MSRQRGNCQRWRENHVQTIICLWAITHRLGGNRSQLKLRLAWWICFLSSHTKWKGDTQMDQAGGRPWFISVAETWGSWNKCLKLWRKVQCDLISLFCQSCAYSKGVEENCVYKFLHCKEIPFSCHKPKEKKTPLWQTGAAKDKRIPSLLRFSKLNSHGGCGHRQEILWCLWHHWIL